MTDRRVYWWAFRTVFVPTFVMTAAATHLIRGLFP